MPYTVSATIAGAKQTINCTAATEREAKKCIDKAVGAGGEVHWDTFAKVGAKPFKVQRGKPELKPENDVHL